MWYYNKTNKYVSILKNYATYRKNMVNKGVKMDLLKFNDKELYYFHVLLNVIMENKDFTLKGVSYAVLDEMPELVELLKSGQVFKTYQIPGKLLDAFSDKYLKYEGVFINRLRDLISLADENSSVYEVLKQSWGSSKKAVKAFLAPSENDFDALLDRLENSENIDNVAQFLQFLGIEKQEYNKLTGIK